MSREASRSAEQELTEKSESDRLIMESEREAKERNALLAGARSAWLLQNMDLNGDLRLETDSVYGAALALPQIARCTGWSKTYTLMALRSFCLLVLNLLLQTFLLAMLGEELQVWNKYGGKMNLCDFGRHLIDCPGSPNCQGPGGTDYDNPGRLYSFDAWVTRTYVRDSLLAIFPEQRDEIMDNVDPGEYGMESYACRIICLFLFMLSTIRDLSRTLEVFVLLWITPREGTWIKIEEESIAQAAKNGGAQLQLVTYKVDGMPLAWKVVNVVMIQAPKMLMWYCCIVAGCKFLLETSSIVDLIMNSMALGFILSVDEFLFQVLSSTAMKHIMTNLEDYEIKGGSLDALDLSAENAMKKYYQEEFGVRTWIQEPFLTMYHILPLRLMTSVMGTVLGLWMYYHFQCIQLEDGSMTSEDVYLPGYKHIRWISFLFEIEDDRKGPLVFSDSRVS
mmetsp:Transcript_7616/g.13475  ORF Transcript_7616/g.13475 Transcript_7616/m.13475 type:complete len:449 (-) Transcript_7616:31-1377(-)